MAAEQLELRTDDPVLGQIGDELVPEEMRIDPLRNPCGAGVLFDDLSNAPGGVRLTPIRFKEVDGALPSLALQVLGQLTSEPSREEDIAILMAPPW